MDNMTIKKNMMMGPKSFLKLKKSFSSTMLNNQENVVMG